VHADAYVLQWCGGAQFRIIQLVVLRAMSIHQLYVTSSRLWVDCRLPFHNGIVEELPVTRL